MPHEKFTVQKYANVGTQEPFTAAFLGLTDLLNAAQFDVAKQMSRAAENFFRP